MTIVRIEFDTDSVIKSKVEIESISISAGVVILPSNRSNGQKKKNLVLSQYFYQRYTYKLQNELDIF